MAFKSIASIFTATTLSLGVAAKPDVNPSVAKKLAAKGSVDLIITLNSGVTEPLASFRGAEFKSKSDKLEELVIKLEGHAKQSQKSIDNILAKNNNRHSFDETFWISNQRLIRGASAELVQALEENGDILEIREEVIVPLPQTQFTGTNVTAAGASTLPAATNEWGVNLIGAPLVWASGFKGRNVVVASIDTGVMASHAALQANWRSSYGWFDATAKKPKPYDDLGHGTHTMGTIVGLNGIGVAPGAKFMACKACATDGCSEANLLSCAQFLTCPTNPTGGNRDCSKAPDLVSNSWAGGQGTTYFSAAIATWHAAGIIPIFANGNNGPSCGSANSPADNAKVIAVGATNINDGLATFSSLGPSVGGLVKPEISAPGADVRSSWISGSNSYVLLSGTSMATPHVAGVVALMLSKKATLTYEQVKSALTTTTETAKLLASGQTCGGTPDTTYPNNQYGFGRVNAVAAMAKV